MDFIVLISILIFFSLIFCKVLKSVNIFNLVWISLLPSIGLHAITYYLADLYKRPEILAWSIISVPVIWFFVFMALLMSKILGKCLFSSSQVPAKPGQNSDVSQVSRKTEQNPDGKSD
jgi:hypothetical protein